MSRATRVARSALRTIAGPDSALEQRLVGRVHTVRRRGRTELHGRHFAALRAGQGPRVAVALAGACDLPSLFGMVRFVPPSFRGTLVVAGRTNVIAATRSDFLLATLDHSDTPASDEAIERLRLPADYFSPQAFDREVTVRRLGASSKDVVVLSLAADLMRPLYRHRADGFLVDPGSWWLQGVDDQVLGEQAAIVEWMRSDFEPLGRLTLDQIQENYRRLVPLLQERTGAQVVVYNTLVVEPADPTHTFQHRRNPEGLRRRELHVMLAMLSAELGFTILDVDRVLKGHGVDEQLDFAHFPQSAFEPLAREGVRVLDRLGVI